LVYDEAAYHGSYRDAIAQTSLDYQTLRNYAWVARRFSLSRRRDSLSFGHHAEVAALPEAEQDFWLRKADERGWAVKRLRREVRASLAQRAVATHHSQPAPDQPQIPAPAQPPMARLTIQLTQDQLQACQAAADTTGLTLHQWAILSLDQAARHGLGTRLLHLRPRLTLTTSPHHAPRTQQTPPAASGGAPDLPDCGSL
jgi:hypothetical protein